MNIALSSQKGPGVAVVRPKQRRSREVTCDDLALIDACRRGEHRAMETLYHRYRRRVYGVVSRIVGPSDRDEVSQEIFVRIFRGLPKFRGDAALSTWIYRLSVNAALSHLARRDRRNLGDDELAQLAAPAPAGRDPRLAELLEAALGRLSPGYRAVLVLHDIEGLSHEECAAVLGCRVGTSKSQLHKARAKMRELLAPYLAVERGGDPGGGRRR